MAILNKLLGIPEPASDDERELQSQDALDKALEIGASFDWITPLAAFVQDARNGANEQINVPCDCGWSADQIRRQLKRNGIEVWGLMTVGQTITFTVRKGDARDTWDHLSQWGLV